MSEAVDETDGDADQTPAIRAQHLTDDVERDRGDDVARTRAGDEVRALAKVDPARDQPDGERADAEL